MRQDCIRFGAGRTGVEEVGIGLPLAAEAGSEGAKLGATAAGAAPELLAGPAEAAGAAAGAGAGAEGAGGLFGGLGSLGGYGSALSGGASALSALNSLFSSPQGAQGGAFDQRPQTAGAINPAAIRAALANAQSRGIYSGAVSDDTLSNLTGVDPTDLQTYRQQGATA